MLMDNDLLDAAADAYLEIKSRITNISMTFEDAIEICYTRKAKYVLQVELLNSADRNYAKLRIRNGYQYGSRNLNQGIRPAIHCLGGVLI